MRGPHRINRIHGTESMRCADPYKSIQKKVKKNFKLVSAPFSSQTVIHDYYIIILSLIICYKGLQKIANYGH